MEALEEGDEQIVALLHDVLEDTSVDVTELHELGFGEHIVRAVLLLTHDRTVPYADYIERLAHDPLARRVKLADLADNLRNNRRLESTSDVRARISRYEAAQHFLEAWSRAV
jgi:(p)ppGpp synthase/HD superfamily hydrolase